MPTTHRRTVRIVGRRTPSRAATVSLLFAGLAALVVFVVWRVWRTTDEKIEPYVRTIFDTELPWRCERGHLFESLGQVEPRHCWKCGQLAYPVTRYRCSVHGEVEVAVRFELRADGTVHPSELRFPGSAWVSAQEEPPCPRCQRPMTRIPSNSLAAINSRLPLQDGRPTGPP